MNAKCTWDPFWLIVCVFVFAIFTDITEDNINMEYINEGMIFPRNRDIDGKVILVLKSKLHVRGLRDTDQLIRNFIYWVERLNRWVLNNAM